MGSVFLKIRFPVYLVMNLFNDCTSINHGSKGMKILCTVPQTKYFPSLMNKLIFLKIVQVFKKKKKNDCSKFKPNCVAYIYERENDNTNYHLSIEKCVLLNWNYYYYHDLKKSKEKKCVGRMSLFPSPKANTVGRKQKPKLLLWRVTCTIWTWPAALSLPTFTSWICDV